MLKEIRWIIREHDNAGSLLTTSEKVNLDIITRMYRQQKNYYQSKDSRESIPDRIVNINKPYVRPIVRATAMEGSFITQKEHYDLKKVFGIHTANVVQLADRIEKRAKLAAA